MVIRKVEGLGLYLKIVLSMPVRCFALGKILPMESLDRLVILSKSVNFNDWPKLRYFTVFDMYIWGSLSEKMEFTRVCHVLTPWL